VGKRIIALFLAVFKGILLTGATMMVLGCSNNQPVAEIESKPIYQEELDQFMGLMCLLHPSLEHEMEDPGNVDQIKGELLRLLIEVKLIQKEMSQLDLEPSREEVEEQTHRLDKILSERCGKEVSKILRENNIPKDTLTNLAKHESNQYHLLNYLSRDISEEELGAYIEENTKYFQKPSKVVAYHLAVSDEAKAKSLKVRLEQLEGEKAIKEFCEEIEEDPKVKEINRLSPLFRENLVISPEFTEMLFALEPGDTGGPVSTPEDYHLARVIESVPERNLASEEMKKEAYQIIKRRRFKEHLQSLWHDTEIKFYR